MYPIEENSHIQGQYAYLSVRTKEIKTRIIMRQLLASYRGHDH